MADTIVPMPNWDTRLCVSFNGEMITPITNFNPTLNFPKDIIDSIDGHNLGFSYGNPRFSFDFEILAVNTPVFRRIFAAAVKGARFSVILAKKELESDDWVFLTMQFDECVITDVTPSNVSNDGKAPTSKYTAICLSVKTGSANGNVNTGHVTDGIEDGTF